MSDTPTKRPAKKAVAKRAPRGDDETTDGDMPIPAEPDAVDLDEIFVIDPIIKRYRYLFKGGRILDVSSPYRADSTDREMVLKEAQRRWGGKKDDWKLEGVTTVDT